jgi:small-conductance mechanosensitive channel
MEVGLQDSITTITVYVVWMLGILIALHVFGLNTASLAVAFGALGIGLGFGLQNIFNNFISGIILLFERPIQVGDDVEVNGIWATVKKINVRSTVVQTYDNASLIIPNADFVSTQVTNWSFKDKRLRRNILIGVAYGSDVTLVRDTLLEIAQKTPKVLKVPAPDVLFTDFGDSALIFRLRLWTDIDSMLKVETAIRFEIDRLFRERGIEISFPQRDVHIRSWLPAAKVAVDKGGGEAEKKGEGEREEKEKNG